MADVQTSMPELIIVSPCIGNCIVLKPSEVSEESAQLLEKLCSQYLDKVCT